MLKNEAELRELIDGFVRAISAKDIDGVMSVYAPELVAFDIAPPLQYDGAVPGPDSIRDSRPEHHRGRRRGIQSQLQQAQRNDEER